MTSLLFEALCAVRVAGRDLAVLPYEAVVRHQPWLLEFHSSIEREDSIALTRADYLGAPLRYGALFGLLQGMLLTRHMLFVGYSLSDDDFHAVVHEVRSARVGALNPPHLGTVLTLFDDNLFTSMWADDLDVVSMEPAPDNEPGPVEMVRAARRLQVFLDLVAFEAADLDAYLLDPTYEEMLTVDEHQLSKALMKLHAARAEGAQGSGWDRMERLMQILGSMPSSASGLDTQDRATVHEPERRARGGA